jgi:hypothetical protein
MVLEKLNPKNLLMLRTYLPEILIVALCVAVVKLYIEHRKFEKEVRTEVLTTLTESKNATSKMTDALNRLTLIIQRDKQQKQTDVEPIENSH